MSTLKQCFIEIIFKCGIFKVKDTFFKTFGRAASGTWTLLGLE